MRTYLVLFIGSLAGLLGGPSTLAQSGETSKDWTQDYTLSVQALGRYYWDNHAETYAAQAELLGNHAGKITYRKRWQLRYELRQSLNADHPRRSRIWLNEAYLAYRHGDLYLKGGKQTVKWGTLTGFSAMDLANRYDYYDVLDTEEERLGLWGLETRWSRGLSELQLRVLPSSNRSRLHIQNNRWVHLPEAVPYPVVPTGVLPVAYEGNYSNPVPSIPQLGASFGTELGSVSLRANWFYGENDMPQNSLHLFDVGADGGSYEVQLDYHPIMLSALNASSYLGNWNVWAEAALANSERMVDGQMEADDYVFLSVGADRVWQFEQPEKLLKLVVQYIHVLADPSTPYQPTEIDHVFRRSLIADVDFRLNYRWAMSLRAVGEFATSGYYLQPQLQYQPTDKWKVQLRAALLGGDEAGFFGHFQENSRAAIHLNYYPF